ncbi:helix-turn-helix transcriptional regulator [Klebsiella sp. R390]|uniref:helix-turn-helix transcriptional regulator n=1 Tax=Klebsiella sp. R390 TaxID=2755400 RepID=UPI003DA9D475
MTIYGKDSFYLYGIEKILKELHPEGNTKNNSEQPYVYVTAGMEVHEIYSLLLTRPPVHHSVFITSERYLDTINQLFPGLIKLYLPERLGVEALRQALWVIRLLGQQNKMADYLPRPFKFTTAEQQIMRLLVRGHSLGDIARIRGVSPTTVSVQRNGLMKRTGTKSLQELCSLYSALNPH